MSDPENPPDTAFSHEQHSRLYPDGVGATYWHVARKLVLRQKLARYAPRARVLDVGCATGDVVEYLRGVGFDAFGAEISPAPVPDRRRPYVFCPADARTLPPAFREGVGTLTLLDVLEHLPDPLETLVSLVDAYPRATTVAIMLPAQQELWSRFDDYYGHLRRYDAAATQELLGAAKLDVVEIGHFFHCLYWPMWLQVRLGPERSLDMKPPRSRHLDSLMGHVLALDERMFPARWRGTSIIAIGRRRP